MEYLFENMTHPEVYHNYLELYIATHGKDKASKVKEKTLASSFVIHNTQTCVDQGRVMTMDIIDVSLNSTFYFMFSKGETFALGSIFMYLNYRDKLIIKGIIQISMNDELAKAYIVKLITRQFDKFSRKFGRNLAIIQKDYNDSSM